MTILDIQSTEGRDAIVVQLRALADSIEATGGAGSAVCVIGPGADNEHPTVFIAGQDAMASLMMASATLEVFIDSIPATATRL